MRWCEIRIAMHTITGRMGRVDRAFHSVRATKFNKSHYNFENVKLILSKTQTHNAHYTRQLNIKHMAE